SPQPDPIKQSGNSQLLQVHLHFSPLSSLDPPWDKTLDLPFGHRLTPKRQDQLQLLGPRCTTMNPEPEAFIFVGIHNPIFIKVKRFASIRIEPDRLASVMELSG